jgi:Terminase large subunit, T4likevirus-type, N-terminal
VNKRAITLLEACDDGRLLGFSLWPRQRELLEAVERGPRLQVWCLGRRSGKTTLAALVALHNLLFRPDLDALVRPGEVRFAVGVATNIKQSRLFLRAALSIAEHSPLLAAEIEAVNEDLLTFRGGRALAAFPCNSRGGRGWPISCLLMDEAAHFLSETQTEASTLGENVFRALMPATAQFGAHGQIVVSSTPFGTAGFFADIYARAKSDELADAQAHHATTAEVNPTITTAFLTDEERRDPESFRSEFLAEFVGSGGAFFEPDRLAEVMEPRRELHPSDGKRWILGFDPSFARDPAAIAIVGQDVRDPQRLVLGHVERFLPQRTGRSKRKSRDETELMMTHVLDRVADVALRFGARVVTDQHLPATVVDELRARGVRSVDVAAWSAQSRTDAFSALRSRVYMGPARIGLYNDGVLLAELQRLRSRYRSGSATVEVPRTSLSHCDEAVALASAVYEHDRDGAPRSPLVWVPRLQQPALTQGLVGLESGFVRGDATRRARWYDREPSLLDRQF